MLTKDLEQIERSIPRFATLFRVIKVPAWAAQHGLKKGELLYRPLLSGAFISLSDERLNWHLGATHVKALCYINLNGLKKNVEMRPFQVTPTYPVRNPDRKPKPSWRNLRQEMEKLLNG